MNALLEVPTVSFFLIDWRWRWVPLMTKPPSPTKDNPRSFFPQLLSFLSALDAFLRPSPLLRPLVPLTTL